MKIAITGSSGYVGNYLSQYLCDKGNYIYGLQRKESHNQNKNFKFIEYNLEKSFPIDCLDDVKVIIHTAFVEHSKKCSNAQEINYKATKKILEAIKDKDIRLIFLSTLSAHDLAKSDYGIGKLRTEKLFKHSIHTVLRLGLVVGKGGLFSDIFNFVKKSPLMPLIGGGNQPIQLIYWRDLCEIIEKIIFNNNLHGSMNIGSVERNNMKDLNRSIARCLGLKRYFINVPMIIFQIMVNLIEFLNIPVSVSSENFKGLQAMRHFSTDESFKKLDIEVKTIEEIINLYIIEEGLS